MKKPEKLAQACALMQQRWGKQRRGGRPRRRFDETEIIYLAYHGYADYEIAAQFGCDKRTLRRRCARLLKRSRATREKSDARTQPRSCAGPLTGLGPREGELMMIEYRRMQIAEELATTLRAWGKTEIRIRELVKVAMSDPFRAEDIIGEPQVVRQVLLTYLKHLYSLEWGQCVLTHDAVGMQAYEEKTRRKSWRKLAAQLGVRL